MTNSFDFFLKIYFLKITFNLNKINKINKIMQGKPHEIIGPVKIKDGLYIGDHYAAQV